MDFNHRAGKLRDLRAYFPKILKFYEFKDEYLSHVIFVLMLLVSFLGSFMPGPVNERDIINNINPWTILAYLLAGIITKLALTVYLEGCIQHFKEEEYSLLSVLKVVLRKSLPVIAASALYTLFTTVLIAMFALSGLFILALPVLVLYFMFLFNTCYIVDRNYGILSAFKASKNLTKGNKFRIFLISFTFSIMFILVSLFIISIFITSGSMLIYTFVLYFILTLFNLMNERLTAIMYCDLEYGKYSRELDEGDGEV